MYAKSLIGKIKSQVRSLRISENGRYYKCNFSNYYKINNMSQTEPLAGEVPTKKLKSLTTLDHLK